MSLFLSGEYMEVIYGFIGNKMPCTIHKRFMKGKVWFKTALVDAISGSSIFVAKKRPRK